MTSEVPTGCHEYLAQDRVIWGVPAAQAVLAEARRRDARRLLITASGTLNRANDAGRGIDHAVEGICSIQASPLVRATSLEAWRLSARALPRSGAVPEDLHARLHGLQAAWLAGPGFLRVPDGASHGIGHSLGAVTGMSHGDTELRDAAARHALQRRQNSMSALHRVPWRSSGSEPTRNPSPRSGRSSPC